MKFTVNEGERLRRDGKRYEAGDEVEMTKKDFEAQPSLARVLTPAKDAPPSDGGTGDDSAGTTSAGKTDAAKEPSDPKGSSKSAKSSSSSKK